MGTHLQSLKSNLQKSHALTQKWPSEPRRSESSVNTVPDTVPPFESSSSEWRSASHKRYTNPYTGGDTLKRHSVGIWECKKSGVKISGGAYVPETVPAKTVKYGLKRLREAQQI